MLKNLFCVPLLATLPILVDIMGCTSCSLSDCDTYRIRGPSRGGGIMNDSLFMFRSSALEEEYCMALGMGGASSRWVGDHKLVLADIRFKKIYWEKKIPSTDLISIQDSVLIFGSWKVDKIAFLKLGDENFQQAKQIELKFKEIKIEDEKQKKAFHARVRPWQNGLLLVNFKHYNYTSIFDNDYGLLDTAAGIIKPWKPFGEFEWLNGCSDARWSLAGGLCLKEIADTLGFVLLRNGTDTLAIRYMPSKLAIDGMDEEYRTLIFSGNSIISRGWIYLIDALGQVSEKPLDIWVEEMMSIFYNSSGERTNYNEKY